MGLMQPPVQGEGTAFREASAPIHLVSYKYVFSVVQGTEYQALAALRGLVCVCGW